MMDREKARPNYPFLPFPFKLNNNTSKYLLVRPRLVQLCCNFKIEFEVRKCGGILQ